jgi:hypothetical protein
VSIEATNTAVGAEPTITSKANSAVSFSELEQLEADEARAKKEAPKKKAEPKEAKEKAEPKKAKASAKTFDDDTDDAEADEDEKTETDADSKARKKEADDDKGEDKDEPEKAKPKTKVHKFKTADGEEVKVSGDHLTTVSIGGKDEEVSLQDLKNHYSGKVSWDRKFSELDREKKAHTEQVGQLTKTVSDLFVRASKNPEDAYDFLAELTGKDAVQLKEQILRQQWEAMRHLAEMPEGEREEWFKDQVRGWRDRKYERRDEAEKKSREEAEHSQKLRIAKEHHGISDEGYAEAERLATKYLNGEKPTPEQVIYAERHLTALEAIHEAVPHLEKHAKFGSIVEDIVQDMLRHPKAFGKDRLQALLKETFPEDDKALGALAKKVKKAADLDGDERPQSRESGKKSTALLWDDL